MRIAPFPFESRVRKEESGCWIWTGAVAGNGYGQYRDRGAHRVAYEMARGPIPATMLVLHECDNPLCVNPAHLRLGTQSENMRDMSAKGRAWQQQKTHCRNGHEYSEANTYRYNGRRSCRACNRLAVAALKQRRLAEQVFA